MTIVRAVATRKIAAKKAAPLAPAGAVPTENRTRALHNALSS